MALQDYQKTPWVNGTAPAINATHLLNIENGIERVTEATQVNEGKWQDYQARTSFPPPLSTDTVLGGIKHRIDTDPNTGYVTLHLWTTTPPN